MFVHDDYSENIVVCEYVWRKNIEYGLLLNNSYDIQRVANRYAEKMGIEACDADELIEKDSELLRIAKKYVRTEKAYHFTIKNDSRERSQLEAMASRNGGYAFNDDYDDRGIDEFPDGQIKLQ